MSTYKNCYALVASVRRALGEYSEAKVRGEDTFGGYHNDYITEKINEAVRELFAFIVRRVPGLFFAETNLTGVNSVYTLPWDFGKLVYFKDENGLKVHEISEPERRLTDSTGSDRMYRRVGNTLVLDKSGVSSIYTLSYRKKPRDIHHGICQAGGALSITLDEKKAPKIADYFNGMTIENVTSDWVDTISDYTAVRVATLAAETAVKNDVYGLVPEIPEWAHDLIAPLASLHIRDEHPLAKRKPTGQEWTNYRDHFRTIMVEYAAPSEDVDYEEMFTSFEPKLYSGVVIE